MVLGAWPFTANHAAAVRPTQLQGVCTYVPGSNGPGSENPSIDSTFA
jgi:hypothetical protein